MGELAGVGHADHSAGNGDAQLGLRQGGPALLRGPVKPDREENQSGQGHHDQNVLLEEIAHGNENPCGPGQVDAHALKDPDKGGHGVEHDDGHDHYRHQNDEHGIGQGGDHALVGLVHPLEVVRHSLERRL